MDVQDPQTFTEDKNSSGVSNSTDDRKVDSVDETPVVLCEYLLR